MNNGQFYELKIQHAAASEHPIARLLAVGREADAKIAELQAEVAKWKDNYQTMLDAHTLAQAECDQAIQAQHLMSLRLDEKDREIAALKSCEVGAKRYRWLRGNGAIISRTAGIPLEFAHFGVGLDSAIDSALAKSQPRPLGGGDPDEPYKIGDHVNLERARSRGEHEGWVIVGIRDSWYEIQHSRGGWTNATREELSRAQPITGEQS